MKKTIIFLGIFLFLSSGLSFFLASSQEEPKLAPVNPAFLEYMNQVERGVYKYYSDDGHPLGYIPSPVDLSHIDRAAVQTYFVTAAPATYDLRTTGKLTPVKDQGTCGACWAFATFGSLESWLRTGETWDFAEQYLSAEHPFDSAECVGGNAFMSDAMLTNWDGPHNESDYVYPYGYFIPYTSIEAIAAGPVQKHVQEVKWLPQSVDTVKNHIMSSGAVYVYFYWDGAYYNSTYDAYYYNGGPGGNHTVCIVGWDDNFDASKFIDTPLGNGAWLMKNSWGTSFGDSGYFWMSYLDSSLGGPVAFHNAEPTSNYGGIYSHDEFGWVFNFGPLAWGANMFTATSDHSIAAVGFYTNDIGTNYSVYLYTNLTDDTNPRSGTLAATKTGTMSFTGSHTVVLDSPVPVTNGSKFSVVIYLDQSYENALVLEGPYAGYSSGCTSNAKESFYSFDGTSWTDFDTYWPDHNVLIKAFVAGEEAAVKNDFNGDGQGDILWRNYSTGQNGVWYMGNSGAGMAGLSVKSLGMMDMNLGMAQAKIYQNVLEIGNLVSKSVERVYGSPLEVQDIGVKREEVEFDWKELGDARETQVVMEPGHIRDAEVSIQGLAIIGSTYLYTISDTDWKIVGTGDFNGDGKVDMLWRNNTNGQNAVWYMDGVAIIGSAIIYTISDPDWFIAGIGDYNGDGKVDTLWRNYANGQNGVWYMDGVSIIGSAMMYTISDTDWHIVGTGDLNTDGNADILWQNYADGKIAVWYMDGISIAGSANLYTVADTDWKIAGMGDFNEDGKADILWRNYSDGQNAVWYMNGAAIVGSEYFYAVPDTYWKIENH